MNDFLEHYRQHPEAVAKTSALNKEVVFDALAAANLSLVELEFECEGDSGQIDEITAYAGDVCVELPSASLTLQQATYNERELRTLKVSLHEAV